MEIVLLGPSDRVESRCIKAGIEPIVLAGPKFGRMIALAHIVRERDSAILHSHCEPIWASLVLALCGPRWIVHLHVYALQKSGRDRIGNLLRRRCAHRFVAISQSVAGSFLNMGLVTAKRLGTVHNGLDFEALPKRPERDATRESFTIAFIGRAVREKGLFDFVEAAALLRNEPGLDFVIAGEGDDLPDARDLIAAYGLDDRISVLGFVEDVGALWRKVDILLMLSTREPFGLVILEAIGSGVAVIGYDIPSGGSEIMAAIPGCQMVTAFSIEELATAIRTAARNRGTLAAAVATGRSVIEAEFSLDRMVEGLELEYKHLSLPT